MRYLKALAVIALIAAYPAVALAHRAASRSQKTALTKAFDKYVNERAPAHCLSFSISTANSTWAEVAFNGKSPAACVKYASNGVVIFHDRNRTWRFVTAGSSFISGNGVCRVPGVPRNVVRDFKLCG